MSMRLRYFAALKAKALKEVKEVVPVQTLAVKEESSAPVEAEVQIEPTPVVPDPVLDTETPPEVVVSEPEVVETPVEEAVSDSLPVDDESPKKKGKRFGKDSA
jgi:hypothetical protein